MPIRPSGYSRAWRLAGLIRPWTVGTSGSIAGEGAGLAARVTGPVLLLNVRERSPGPGHRPCFESASPGRAEPAAVTVSVGFRLRLRGCRILHCRFAGRGIRRVTGRRTRRVVPLRLLLRGHAR